MKQTIMDNDQLHTKWEYLKPTVVKQLEKHENRKRVVSTFLTILSVLIVLSIPTYIVVDNQINIRTTDIGKQLTMPDGTIVRLNINSSITYAKFTFFRSERSVKFSGEGFFEVAHNPQKPFVIESDRYRATVLGTSFNLNCNAQRAKPMLTVKTGKVKLENKLSGTETIALAGEKIRQTHQNRFIKEPSKDENDFAWHTRKLQFQNTAMVEVVAVLQEYFLVPILLDQPEMERIQFTGSFQDPTLKEVIDVLQVALKAKVMRESNGYRLVYNNML